MDIDINDIDIDIESCKNRFLEFQDLICRALADADGGVQFCEDRWQRDQGGGGITRVISNGQVFEKGGVNFSHVYGNQLPASATQHRPELAGRQFQAMGVSLVLHPNSPMIPTSHANVRLFIAPEQGKPTIWWVGGGFDLTPYYGFTQDCRHWHSEAKAACDPFGPTLYPRFKAWCDEYFFLKHRQECRGIGGLFFDDFNELPFDQSMNFLESVVRGYLLGYVPIVQKRRNLAFTDQQKSFQLYRRGRYVEFNLVYDRGTLFGLQSNGRTESILMSLPPHAQWRYDWQPTAGSEEDRLTQFFLKPQDWLSMESP